MADHSDIPPAKTVEPIAAPPDSARPTVAMLKADINSGRTGDKTEVHDPGLSPLGTDDEAAGHPPSAFRIALARFNETTARWQRGSRPAGAAHNTLDGFPVVYVSFIVATAIVLLVGITMVAPGG
ncbi:MAG: hypothetical protein ABW026_19425 [Microvirga sp.]